MKIKNFHLFFENLKYLLLIKNELTNIQSEFYNVKFQLDNIEDLGSYKFKIYLLKKMKKSIEVKLLQ